MAKILMLAAALVFSVSALRAEATVVEPELEAALGAISPGEPVPVIIYLYDKADVKRFRQADRRARSSRIIRALREKAGATQGPLRAYLESRGARRVKSLWIKNAVAAEATPEMISELASRPEVESIKLDRLLMAPVDSYGTTGTGEWNLGMIRAPELWGMGFTGAGAVVANMDTGVDINHPDLRQNWRAGLNSWYDPNNEHPAPYDAGGHGTQTMGLMAGGSASGSAIGVAPQARWIAVKIFNDRGAASYSAIHLGFEWLLDPDKDPDTDDAPNVVLGAWGLGNINGCDDEFLGNIQVLNSAGIAVVMAAGNDGPGPYTSVSPANYAESVAVGALDEGAALAWFSSRGPSACNGGTYPVLAAPGVNVRTADRTYGGVIPDSYASVTGTSYAAAHAGGVFALLYGAFPDIGLPVIETALRQSAANAKAPDNDLGYGLMDAFGAYNSVLLAVATDSDGDGYDSGADCNDNDPSVNPGAVEIKHDGIDQNCNGYDLTIDILKARYYRAGVLTVEAKSSLGKAAGLELSGYGPMRWNSIRSSWIITVRRVASNPGTITVSGAEGAQSAIVQ